MVQNKAIMCVFICSYNMEIFFFFWFLNNINIFWCCFFSICAILWIIGNIFLHIAYYVWFRLYWIECVARTLEEKEKYNTESRMRKMEEEKAHFFSTVQWIFDGFHNAFCNVILCDCESYTTQKERPHTANITKSLIHFIYYMRKKKKRTLFHAFVYIDWCCVYAFVCMCALLFKRYDTISNTILKVISETVAILFFIQLILFSFLPSITILAFGAQKKMKQNTILMMRCDLVVVLLVIWSPYTYSYTSICYM